MNNSLMQQYRKLDLLRRDLDAKLKDAKEKLSQLEPEVRDQLIMAGMDKITVNAKPTKRIPFPRACTIYVKRDLWAKVPDAPGAREAAVAALKDAGLDMYVGENFNSQSLSAYLREVEGLMPYGQHFESCATFADLETKWADLPEDQRPQLPDDVQSLKNAIGVSETFKIQTRLG